MSAAAEAEAEEIANHVTDLQQPDVSDGPDDCGQNGEAPTSPMSDAEASTAGGGGDGQTGATGLATPAAKRRRYRSLFGNIGKLITFNRRKPEQPPASPAGDQEPELPFSPAETVSLDLVVPETPSGGDQVSDQVLLELETPLCPEVASEAAAAPTDPTEAAETQAPETQEQLAIEHEEPVGPEAEEKKKKMEYDMSLGGISTIPEETAESVRAQESELFSEADLIKLESELDLADYSSQKMGQEPKRDPGLGVVAGTAPRSSHGARDGKASLKEVGKLGPALQNQISESDSGCGCSLSDSPPVEAEVDRPEKPQPHVEEAEGSNGGSDVFTKETEDTTSLKSALKADALISPSEEELDSFEKAELSVEDSMVDLEGINVKLDSLIESNSPDRLVRSDEQRSDERLAVARVRASESLEEDDDEDLEPVELDLSSNQSVRRRKLLEAKARRQHELEAARRQQEEALTVPPTQFGVRSDAPDSDAPVRDKDIVDGLGPRRHSHENNACSEGAEGGRSRMKSRLPVRRSASCPRRTVEDYSTYIRSGTAAKKPIAHLIESSYSPVKIDFRPLSRTAQETHGEQLTPPGPQQQPTGCEARVGQAGGPAGKRGSRKVHFNSPSADQVVTYAAAVPPGDSEEMKPRDGEECGQQPLARAKPAATVAGSGAKVVRQRSGETEKPATDRSLIKAISVKQTLASRKRLEKLHEDAVKQLGLQDESQYMTPLQRKDLEVKELRRQLDEAYFVIEQRELELDVFHHDKTRSIEDAVKDREEKIACLQVQITQLESDFACLRAQHSEICRRERKLVESLEQLKVECAEREQRHQDLYLEMYRKGRDSAKFERQDEIEKLAVLEPDKVAMEELLEKLEITQHDLQKWQSIKLKEAYEDSDHTATEAEAKLRFLRDSMFHYLTEKDREQNQQHLTAMIGIFSFTDVQMKHIMKSLDERRRKGKL